MLLDTNIIIYACQPDGAWLDPWTAHPDAAIASVTHIEALGYAGAGSGGSPPATQDLEGFPVLIRTLLRTPGGPR